MPYIDLETRMKEVKNLRRHFRKWIDCTEGTSSAETYRMAVEGLAMCEVAMAKIKVALAHPVYVEMGDETQLEWRY